MLTHPSDLHVSLKRTKVKNQFNYFEFNILLIFLFASLPAQYEPILTYITVKSIRNSTKAFASIQISKYLLLCEMSIFVFVSVERCLPHNLPKRAESCLYQNTLIIEKIIYFF
jgi:hypothetical protein